MSRAGVFFCGWFVIVVKGCPVMRKSGVFTYE